MKKSRSLFPRFTSVNRHCFPAGIPRSKISFPVFKNIFFISFFCGLDLPFDQSCRLIWSALAGDPKLASTVLLFILTVFRPAIWPVVSAHLVCPGRWPQAGQHCARYLVGRSQSESGAALPLINVVTLHSVIKHCFCRFMDVFRFLLLLILEYNMAWVVPYVCSL